MVTRASHKKNLLAGKGAQVELPQTLHSVPIWIWAMALPMFWIGTTCFLKFTVVLSILRSALHLQDVPGFVMVLGVSVWMSVMVMAPAFSESLEAWQQMEAEAPKSVLPLAEQVQRLGKPWVGFARAHAGEAETTAVLQVSQKLHGAKALKAEHPIVLMLAFVLTELKEAFLVGFLLFLPFLAIDLIAGHVLAYAGLSSLPIPAVTMPIKLLLFVVVEGWTLLFKGVAEGYGGVPWTF